MFQRPSMPSFAFGRGWLAHFKRTSPAYLTMPQHFFRLKANATK